MSRVAGLLLAASVAAWLGLIPLVAGAEEISSEQCAALLQKATVTVRVRLHPEGKSEAAANAADLDPANVAAGEPDAAQVTVCSGVAVSDRLVVTAAFAAADSQIRITLPGGEQSAARLCVLDEFSGLALLESGEARFAPLPFAEQSPATGSWIMTAAGWGAEQPLVSVGVVGGVKRAIKGCVYPPLLQCDVRSAETSGGAAVVDHHGKLLGIIVAAEGAEAHRGWAYAVPVSHVQRLLRARQDRSREDTVVVLKRRRPTVGLVLESGDAGVTVSRVHAASPAEKAGIQPGDRIVQADGLNVRSVYEAVRPTLYKQPGDTLTFLIRRGEEEKQIEVVLGGGVELPGASLSVLGQLMAPKIDLGLAIKRDGAQRAQAAEVTIRENFSAVPGSAEGQGGANGDKERLLEKANERYRNVIAQQQRELARQEEELRRQGEMIESLSGKTKRNNADRRNAKADAAPEPATQRPAQRAK